MFRFSKWSFDQFDLCGRYSRVHILQIMSAYAWAVLQKSLGYGSVHWMAWTEHLRSLVLAIYDLAWVPPNLQGHHLLLSGVMRWVFALQDTLLCWVPRRWSFGCPRLQSWPFCNFEPVSSRFNQSVELREDWISKQWFSMLSQFQS